MRKLIAAVLCLLFLTPALAWNPQTAIRISDVHWSRLQELVVNQLTGKRERREGQRLLIRVINRFIWCTLPTYDGAGYVIMPVEVTDPVIVEIPAAEYGSIYKQLASHDANVQLKGYAMVEDHAWKEGLIQKPRTEAEGE